MSTNTTHVVALSGGKDSVAMALRMREVWPELDCTYLITPTGDELPEMLAHWERLECLLGKPLTRITNGTLNEHIALKGGLPNHRIRWCTRTLKIEPCLAYLRGLYPLEHVKYERWLRAHQVLSPRRDVPEEKGWRLPSGVVLYVGLRADEEERQGIYSRDVETRFPLREWGWDLAQVQRYLREKGVRIPARTDCARCYGQRLSEWQALLRNHPAIYADAEAQEAATGQTFRSPQRDSWPAGLKELRVIWESQPALFAPDEVEEAAEACRVCRM